MRRRSVQRRESLRRLSQRTVLELGTLPMDEGWAALIVLELGHPHWLEGRERRQNAPPDPHRVLALTGRKHLDPRSRWDQRDQLLRHAVTDAIEHGVATREHDIKEQIRAHVDIALHDGLEDHVVDATRLLAKQRRLEEGLWTPEAFV